MKVNMTYPATRTIRSRCSSGCRWTLRPFGSAPVFAPKYICTVVGSRFTRYLPPLVLARPFSAA
ncbi:MAG: hypothetical protein AMJ79_15260 [Phycisphaerae bacterium SM23_30]|nr:MAG: hypothetical protein AMJ79_15260 [Phycisphaerae bacterium SM23_30]